MKDWIQTDKVPQIQIPGGNTKSCYSVRTGLGATKVNTNMLKK